MTEFVYGSVEAPAEYRKSKSKPAYIEHLGKQRQYWRDIILGVNDGLVSTFLLVSGVSGGGFPVNYILLTSISGAMAGAVSMFAGEYIATKSQHQVLAGEIKLEKIHIHHYHRNEVKELQNLFSLIGIPEDEKIGLDIRDTLVDFYASDEDALLKIMIALEFGVLEEERRVPILAGLVSGFLFLLGSAPSVIPFALVCDQNTGLIAATLCTGTALLLVGIVKSCATREFWVWPAIENLAITGLGGFIAYTIGVGFESMVKSHS
jgi:VIT1/CCC1 family predicted Fe2+/Mn2+ transporter